MSEEINDKLFDETLFDTSSYNAMNERIDDFRDPNKDREVYDLDSTSFSITCPESLQSGDFAILKINPSPSITNNPVCVFDSSDLEVVSVDSEGKVLAKNPGTATITVVDIENGYKQTVSIRVYGYKAKVSVNNQDIAVTRNGDRITLSYNNDEYILVAFTVDEEQIQENTFVAENDCVVDAILKVKTPVITNNAGQVTITCGTTNATIYYSIDDSEWAEYTSELVISSNVTVKAQAHETDKQDSDIETLEITVE